MKVFSNFDLTNYNSYRLKAKCRAAYFPDTEDDLIRFFQEKRRPFVLLGSGHNVILSREYYDEDFIIFNGNFNEVFIDSEGNIAAEAGISMLELSLLGLEKSLSGIEAFYDIPSSLGGAVVMNAGASGEEIKDVLVKVRFLDLVDLKIKEISNEEIAFSYRESFFQKNPDNIILKAWLKLEPKDKILIQEKMESIKTKRWEKQPKEFPNAGSVFKRPVGFYVGAIMDELGLKGYAVGGAKVSEKHGGFIINYNNATGQDILDLIEQIKTRVLENYGIALEVEQRVI